MQNLFKNQIAVRLITILLVSVIAFSCSKSEEVTPQSKLVGTWKLTSLTIKEDSDPEQDFFGLVTFFYPCFKELTFNFTSKGEMNLSVPSACQAELEDIGSDLPGGGANAKYTATDTQISLTASDGSKSVLDYTLVGTNLKIIQTETEGGVKTVTTLGFTKQ